MQRHMPRRATGRLQTSIAAFVLLLSVIAAGCSTTRHVPDGSYLLDRARIEVSDSTGALEGTDFTGYLRQRPNHKMLWSARLQLGVYNLSGKDTTKWLNRLLRRLGEAPVIYDHALTEAGAAQLRKALVNKGYLHASVDADTSSAGKRMRVDYRLRPGRPYTVKSVEYHFPSDTLRRTVMADSARFPMRPGMPLDAGVLDSQREFVTRRLRDRGYYAFAKEFVTFNADTAAGSYEADLTMTVRPPYQGEDAAGRLPTHVEYIVGSVTVITDFDPTESLTARADLPRDTVNYRGIDIIYVKGHHYLRPGVVADNCYLEPGSLYDAAHVDRTYQAFSRLGILNFINIRFVPRQTAGAMQVLDAYVMLTPGRSQSIQFELEGTNSEGDLGVAAGVGYTHRNLGKGSETFTARIRGAYESINGKLDGFIHDRYMEYSVDVGVTFPKFKAPLLRESFKRRIRASTELTVSLGYQERPEYTRIIAAAGWAYKWTERGMRNRHTFSPIDINYVYLPESTNEFIDNIASDNPLLRYSYEDHFIMSMRYSFYHTNKRGEGLGARRRQPYVYTLRVNSEVAGNFLFALSSIFAHRGNFHSRPYKVFGIRYSQYVKAEADYGSLYTFDNRNTLAWHVGFGIGIPYGNSYAMPFEKRFYGGGANGVRGWSVRTLGPGAFAGGNSVRDFIDQCGDIRLDMSAEYRARIIGPLELAVFVDAGNIWTIHDYPNQPGGIFRFNTFYKQIAAAYGLGVRLDFNYFLLRVDLGMKAVNPARGEERWPVIHPRWRRDHAFHFSIGYPF